MSGSGDNERSTLSGRMGRYARTTWGVGGVAARTAGRVLFGRKLGDTATAADIARVLGQLRGPVMKAAQVAGTLPEILPAEFAAELAALQADAPPMGPSFVRRRMEAELGPHWREKFASFEMTPAAAASLGQVHRAVGKDGRALACKLQYPNMQSAVDADLAQLETVLALQRTAERAFDTRDIAQELAARVREELDYMREAAHMRLFRLMLADTPEAAVPEPVADLSTARLLTMTWLDGLPFRKALDLPQADRDALARALFAAWWRPLYRFGVLHGDAHLGNYTVRVDRGINLFDYGSVRILSADMVGGLIDLYRGLQRRDEALTLNGYERLGFRGATPDLAQKMGVWSRLVFEPLLDDRERTIAEGANPFEGGAAQIWAMKRRLWEGGVLRPPGQFVFVARAIVGVASALIHLQASLNWHRMFEDVIAGFDEQSVAARQATALREAGVSRLPSA